MMFARLMVLLLVNAVVGSDQDMLQKKVETKPSLRLLAAAPAPSNLRLLGIGRRAGAPPSGPGTIEAEAAAQQQAEAETTAAPEAEAETTAAPEAQAETTAAPEANGTTATTAVPAAAGAQEAKVILVTSAALMFSLFV